MKGYGREALFQRLDAQVPKQFLDILRTGPREIDTNSGPIVVSLVPYNAKGQSGEDEGKPKFTKKTKREK